MRAALREAALQALWILLYRPRFVVWFCFGAIVGIIIGSVSCKADPYPGPYRARVVEVVDGDTVKVVVEAWPGIEVPVSVRVRGIDTPEIRGKCEAERQAAYDALWYAAALAGEGNIVGVRNVSLDKYAGRVVADVILASGDSWAESLIKVKLARPYEGGKRGSWCAEKMSGGD